MDAPAVCVIHTLLVLTLLPQTICVSCPRPCTCPQPTELHCTFRSLPTIPTSMSKQLERVNLGFNRINEITYKSLAGLRRLQLLMMHGNDVHSLKVGAFKDLTSLQMLKLSYNKLKQISRQNLHGLWALVRLHLDHNQLEFIHPDAFHGLTSLRFLQLEGNHLQQLHPATFTTFTLMGHFHVSTLRHLYLSDNGLMSLSPKLLGAMPQLENLFLSGNPWTCDCNLMWLQSWSQASPGVLKCKKDRMVTGGHTCPTCSSPKHLRGKEVQAVNGMVCNSPVIIHHPLKDRQPEDTESEVLTAEDLKEPFGNISLGFSDEYGNEVDLDCSVGEPREHNKTWWEQDQQSRVASTVVFSVDLECPVDRRKYEYMWRLVAYYSNVPAHLKREMMISKEPHLTYSYRQDAERDNTYYTGVNVNIRAVPAWLMQASVSLRLNRAQSTSKVVKLILSSHLSQTVESERIRRQRRAWVMVISTNATQKVFSETVGGTTTMHCNVRSSSPAVIKWHLPDGSTVDAPYSGPSKRVVASSDGQLVIKSVRHSDAGLYYCIPQVREDLSVLPLRLAVEDSSSPQQGKDSPRSTFQGDLDDIILLPCTASSAPDAEIYWLLPNSDIVSFRNHSSRLQVHANGTLEISQSHVTDAGYYKCIAINQYGLDTQVTKVSINARKELKSPHRPFHTRPSPIPHINPGFKVHPEESMEASGFVESIQEQLPSNHFDPLTRRGLSRPGRNESHTARNTSGKLTKLQRPTVPRAVNRQPVNVGMRRMDMSQKRMNDGKKTDDWSKIRETNALEGVSAIPEQTTSPPVSTGGSAVLAYTTMPNTHMMSKSPDGHRNPLPTAAYVKYVSTPNIAVFNSQVTDIPEEAVSHWQTNTERHRADENAATRAAEEWSTTLEVHTEKDFDALLPSNDVETLRGGYDNNPNVLMTTLLPQSKLLQTITLDYREISTPVSHISLPVSTAPRTEHKKLLKPGQRKSHSRRGDRGPKRRANRRKSKQGQTSQFVAPVPVDVHLAAIMPTVASEMTKVTTPEFHTTIQTSTPNRIKRPETTIPSLLEKVHPLPFFDTTPMPTHFTKTIWTASPQPTHLQPADKVQRDNSSGGPVQLVTLQSHSHNQKTQTEKAERLHMAISNSSAPLTQYDITEAAVQTSDSTMKPETILKTNRATTRSTQGTTMKSIKMDMTLTDTKNGRFRVGLSHSDHGKIYEVVSPPTPAPKLQGEHTIDQKPPTVTIITAVSTDGHRKGFRTSSANVHIKSHLLAQGADQTSKPVVNKSKSNRQRKLTVRLTDSINLECEAEGNGMKKVSWVLPNRTVLSASAHNIVPQQRVQVLSNGTLRITQVTYTDTGVYECIGKDGAMVDTASVHLDVSPLAPVIQQPKYEHMVLLEGSTVLIHCSATDVSSTPLIEWIMPDGIQVGTSHTVVNQNLRVFPNGTLQIHGIGVRDAGMYECTARNEVAVSRRGVIINVQRSSTSARASITFSSQQETDVIYGGKVLLDCLAAGEPKPRIIWRTPAKKLADAHYSFDHRIKVFLNGTLTIHSVTEKDSGTYLCMARNKMGDDYVLLQVNVVTRPAEIEKKQQQSVLEVAFGGRMKVDCVASGLPDPRISWMLPDGTMISPDKSTSVDNMMLSHRHVLFDNGTLYVKGVGTKDEGDYTCHAENPVGKDSMKVTVKVKVSPPVIQGKGQVITQVFHDETLTLTCNTTTQPKPVITWMSPTNKLISPASDKFQVLNNGSLLVQKVQRSDGGNYTCLAKNSAGQDQKVFLVEVLVSPPTIDGLNDTTTTIEVTAVKDKRKLINCVAKGSPKPNVMWVLPGNVVLPAPYFSKGMTVHRNGTLDIWSPQKLDSGQLVCIARNEAGEVKLTVKLVVKEVMEMAQIRDFTSDIFFLTVGHTMILNCSSDGAMPPPLTWRLPDGTTLHSGDSLYKFFHHPDGFLVIRNPSVGEAGVYRCLVNSSVGLMDRTITLFPGAKPEITNRYSSPVSVTNGEALMLHCSTHREPLRLSWTFPSGVVLTRSQRVGRYAMLSNGTLIIEQISIHDQGTYVCQAANEYGSSFLPVSVIVIAFPPHITQSPPTITYAQRGVAVQLNCVATGIPRAEVAWETPDKTRLTVSTQPRLFGNKYLHPYGALIIQNPTEKDAGFYRCTARNVLGVDSKTTYLNVR